MSSVWLFLGLLALVDALLFAGGGGEVGQINVSCFVNSRNKLLKWHIYGSGNVKSYGLCCKILVSQ